MEVKSDEHQGRTAASEPVLPVLFLCWSAQLLQHWAHNLPAELRLASVLFIDAIEHGEAIEPEGNAVHPLLGSSTP